MERSIWDVLGRRIEDGADTAVKKWVGIVRCSAALASRNRDRMIGGSLSRILGKALHLGGMPNCISYSLIP
jgi:hypothetical protein